MTDNKPELREYQRRSLEGIAAGEMVLIIGSSTGGKSRLMQIMRAKEIAQDMANAAETCVTPDPIVIVDEAEAIDRPLDASPILLADFERHIEIRYEATKLPDIDAYPFKESIRRPRVKDWEQRERKRRRK